MSSSGQKTFNVGYRSWFQPFRYNQRVNLPIFVLDYETASFWEEQYDDYLDHENRGIQANTQLVNGIQVYFLDENLQKRKAFLRHEPYFYLLLEEGVSKSEKNRISNSIREIGESQVIHVEEGEYYDAANLTFLVKKSFMKVTVDRPGSVPNLRTKTEEINGVLEWREADVLFHHRTAIDHNVRVGSWYTADIAGGKIQTLTNIPNRAPPALRVLAFDIETVFEQTRDPTPNRDAISVISLFTGDKDSNMNILIVNSHVVETKDLQDFYILLKANDMDHSKPWVDWNTEKELQIDSEVIEKFPIKVIVAKNEKELLDYFYQFIREYQPDVITDFFGGRFDIPFLAVRSEKYGVSFEKETGFKIVLKYRLRGKGGDFTDLKSYSPNNFDYVAGAGIIHLDAYLFNEKYSYLPKKDLGLKPSVERKLKIIPIGREALFAIKDNPVEAIAYAASDGYITWKYVKEIVLDFFISMGQMFPVPASELLTRRSGSLDDLLIDAEDYQHQVIGKKRIGQTNIPSFSSGVVIESLAYTGGLVEARRPGLFRSDIFFDYEPNKVALENLKEIIRRAIEKESQNLIKSIKKEEFERLLGSELEDVRFEYSEDPIFFLSQLETDLLKNGNSAEEISKKMESIRKILEKTSTLHVENVEQVINETCNQIDQLIALEGKAQLRGVHVDVTSMYPSQIRQYKLQPSGIVPLTMCRTCELRETDDSCFFEGDWVIKLTARRPCRFRVEGGGKCDPSICTAQDETKCKKYDPSPHERSRSQEIFTFNGKKTEAYLLTDNSRLEQVPIGRTYLGSNISEDPFVCLQRWLLNSVDATQLTTKLNQNQFDIFEDQPKDLKLPSNTFMSLDVRTKKITVLLSVNSRVCQKAYNFVSRIMDDFYNTRVKHKIETQRLKQVISQKIALNQSINPDLLRQQKFHDSTQLGMKVPLNSIFPDEPIVIIDDEGIRPIQIGDFVNKYINDGESSKNITENIKTFTFDDEGKISLKRITHVFKHKTDHKSFSIITKNGRKVKITEDHSIFILNDEQNIILARGDEIKKGDKIVIPKFFPKAISPFSNDQINLMKLIDPKILDSNDINLIIKVRNGYFISKQWKTEKRILSCVNNGNQGVPIAKLKKLFKEPRTAIRNLNRLIEYGILTVNNDRYASNGYSQLYEELLEILINKSKRNHHTSSYDIPLINILRLVKELPDHIFTNWELGHYSGSYQTPLVSLKKLAQYLGFFVSEGYRRIQNESFDVNICNSEKKLINNMIKSASIFGEPRISKTKNSNVVYIRSGDAVAYSILESIGVGVDSKTKRIPSIIFNSPDEVKLEFLKALISGDGTIDENGKYIRYSSISKSLVYCDLPLLLLMLDIYRFTIKEDQSNNNTIYRIKILQSIADFVDFDYEKRRTSLDLVPNEWIPTKYSKRMSTSLFEEKGLFSRVVESDIWFDSVESVEEISTPEFVYDISVKDTERFFAGHAFLGIHNSIYGLLGMKGGVRNASMPCAGITTKLSADLIHWAANQLEQIGLVTELDTDGIWLWVPKLFPLEIPITVKFPYKDSSSQVFQISLIDKILNEKVISTGFRNDNYWINDGKKIARSSKSLIKFEQDGPYDFQFVMGKKKYIVYNYDEKKNEWIEEELTGLESKRADFSQLQKYFQERIINSYLKQYYPYNPIPLDQLYQNAIETADQIRTEMIDGNLDPSYFVKPKAINKPLKSYKSKLPQVSAAYILKDLGFSVDPGTRIQMLNIKGNHVIPRQIFDFDFNKIKEVLVKHAICTLSFMLGELSTKEDLRKLIDVRQYQEDIFGPGRIYDRMIRYPMEIQKIKATTQQILDIKDIEDISIERKIGITMVEQEPSVPEKKSPIKKTKMIKRKKKIISRRSRGKISIESKKPQRRKIIKTRGLDDHFKKKRTEKIPLSEEKSIKVKTEKKTGREERLIESNFNETKLTASFDPSLVTSKEEPIKLTPLVSDEELDELESSELFTNGLTNNQAEYISDQESLEENIVCSECGALVNPQEITSEGCVFCGGRKISQ